MKRITDKMRLDWLADPLNYAAFHSWLKTTEFRGTFRECLDNRIAASKRARGSNAKP